MKLTEITKWGCIVTNVNPQIDHTRGSDIQTSIHNRFKFSDVSGETIDDFKLFQLLTHKIQRLAQLRFPCNLLLCDLGD